MKKIKKLFENKLILVFLLLILAVGCFFLVKNLKTDEMENSGITKVYYRTYTKEKGWSSWSKNGITSGNLKNNILKIQVKVKNTKEGNIKYRTYDINNNWSKELDNNSKVKDSEITGIKMALSGSLRRKADVCYRTYNDDNKWMEWSCNDIINGNISQDIKGIEIKIIPKNVVLRDYLKDYNNVSKKENIGF